MSGYTFIKKKASPGLKTSVYVRKTSIHFKSIMKRLPKEECEKENERLRKENERLRAENLVLKKVKAIVEERESRNRRIGRGPLTN